MTFKSDLANKDKIKSTNQPHLSHSNRLQNKIAFPIQRKSIQTSMDSYFKINKRSSTKMVLSDDDDLELPEVGHSSFLKLINGEIQIGKKKDISKETISELKKETEKKGKQVNVDKMNVAESELGCTQLERLVIVSDDEDNEDKMIQIQYSQSKKRNVILSSEDEDEDEDVVVVKEVSNRPINLGSSPLTSIQSSPTPLTPQKLAYQDLVYYFNNATKQELLNLSKLTPDMISLVESTRPYRDLEDLEAKLTKSKNKTKGKRIIEKFTSMNDGFNAVDNLIEDCRKYFKELNAKSRNGSQYKVNEKPDCLDDNFSLKDYQVEGVNWLLSMYFNKCGVILADEMGLGKTCQVITMLARLHQLGKNGPHLIVVPSSVLDNWLNEIDKFCPQLKVLAYRGSQKERAEIQALFKQKKLGEYQVILTSYSICTSDKYDRHFMSKQNIQSMILDEAHMVKNKSTQSHKFLMKMETQFRCLLTGTPLQNNLMELINLLTFINPHLFTKDWIEIIEGSGSLDVKDTNGFSDEAKELYSKRIERIRDMMCPFLLRRCKEQVLQSLPTKTEEVIRIEMNSAQIQRYQYELDLALKNKEKGLLQLNNLSTKLRRIANHTMLIPNGYHYSDQQLKSIAKSVCREDKFSDSDPRVVYEELKEYCDSDVMELCNKYPTIKKFRLKDEQWMSSGKIQWLKENLYKMIENGDRILIFSQFTMVLDILELVMGTLNLTYYRMDGTTPVDERQPMIDSFNQDNRIKIFLISTKSGGCGINLTGANTVIIHDLDHNPQNDRQAEARAHRVGQTRSVKVFKLVCKDTIEERILEIGKNKLMLDSKVQGDARMLLDNGDMVILRSLFKEFF